MKPARETITAISKKETSEKMKIGKIRLTG
jgi:hypothetical protein